MSSSSSRGSASLRFWLREQTHPLHQQVDQAFGGYALREQAGYAAFLQAHAAALAPIEAWLQSADVLSHLPDWNLRARLPALADDLARLGVARPAPVAWQCEPTPAALWGVCYVLEGSRLGARYLVRAVPEGLPTAYLRHGEGLPLWPTFVEQLEQASALPREPLLAAAHAAFDAFQRAARQASPAQA